MLDYLDCRRSRPPTPRHPPTAADNTAAAHYNNTTHMDRAARERQQRLEDRERERKRREQLQQEEEEEDDDSDSDVIELSPPASSQPSLPLPAARVVHTHQHEHHHHHHHTIALQPTATKGAPTRWMTAATSTRNGLHAAGGRTKRRRTQPAWQQKDTEVDNEEEDEEEEYGTSEKEEKAPQRITKKVAVRVGRSRVASRQSSILQHLTKQPKSPASTKLKSPVKEEKMKVDDEEEEEESEKEDDDEEEDDDEDDEEYVQQSEEDEDEEEEDEEEAKEVRPPTAPAAHSLKGRGSTRTSSAPRRNIIKDEDDEDEVKEVKASRPSSRRNSLSSDSKTKHEHVVIKSSASGSSSSASDFLSPFAPLPPPLPPSPRPPPFPVNRPPAPLAIRVGWRGDEGREADGWVEKVRKVVYSSPSLIRIRYVLRAAATTQPSVLTPNRLSSAVQHAMAVFVSHLMVHASAAAFLQPVNPYALLIPDYFNIVHHPLSLSCIAARLTTQYYSHPLQLLCDVRRVVECCWLYNECDSEVSDRARQLWGWVEAVVRGEMSGELGRAGRELGKAKGVDVAMREWSERSVVQCVWFMVPRVDVHVAVSAEQLPRAVVRRLGRRMGRVPTEWSSEWLQHATSE